MREVDLRRLARRGIVARHDLIAAVAAVAGRILHEVHEAGTRIGVERPSGIGVERGEIDAVSFENPDQSGNVGGNAVPLVDHVAVDAVAPYIGDPPGEGGAETALAVVAVGHIRHELRGIEVVHPVAVEVAVAPGVVAVLLEVELAGFRDVHGQRRNRDPCLDVIGLLALHRLAVVADRDVGGALELLVFLGYGERDGGLVGLAHAVGARHVEGVGSRLIASAGDGARLRQGQPLGKLASLGKRPCEGRRIACGCELDADGAFPGGELGGLHLRRFLVGHGHGRADRG